DSGAVLDKLLERGLVEIVSRGEGLGRPLLYGTTPQFLEILGLRDLDELPRLDELSAALRPPAPAEPGGPSCACQALARAPAGRRRTGSRTRGSPCRVRTGSVPTG